MHDVLSMCQSMSETGNHPVGKTGDRSGNGRKVFVTTSSV